MNLANISCIRIKVNLQDPKLFGSQYNTNHRIIGKIGNQNLLHFIYIHLAVFGYTV